MNEILGDHNVDKQMTDSKGDVCFQVSLPKTETLDNQIQVAYLMADISNVDAAKIKDLYERLESLSCMAPVLLYVYISSMDANKHFIIARIMTRILY